MPTPIQQLHIDDLRAVLTAVLNEHTIVLAADDVHRDTLRPLDHLSLDEKAAWKRALARVRRKSRPGGLPSAWPGVAHLDPDVHILLAYTKNHLAASASRSMAFVDWLVAGASKPKKGGAK